MATRQISSPAIPRPGCRRLHASPAAALRRNSIPTANRGFSRWFLCLNGSKAAGSGRDCRIPVDIRQTRTFRAVRTPADALEQLRAVVLELSSNPPSSPSGVIRLEVPIQQQVDAVSWLHSQPVLPCFYFSGRSSRDKINAFDIHNGLNGEYKNVGEKSIISVAGVGSAVYFQQPTPFSLEDWWCIRRFLYKDCPLVRAYGAMRFDPSTNVSFEWQSFGSFYFIIPQVEINELKGSSILATTIAWDESLLWSWEKAMGSIQATLSQISSSISEFGKEEPAIVLGVNHMPDKASWEVAVRNALKAINSTGFNSKLHKISLHSNNVILELVLKCLSVMQVVLARSSRVHTNASIDPLHLLASLQKEGRHFYQFCIRPPQSPAFIGNTPEQLFHRLHLSVSSEAVAGTRPRGKFLEEDIQIEHDFLLSPKDHLEFEIVRETIRRKLEMICDQVIVEPEKMILKLPRVQHLCARILGKLRSEEDEFDVLSHLHPTPAVCGFPTDEARQFIEETGSSVILVSHFPRLSDSFYCLCSQVSWSSSTHIDA
ncbi:Isochorismate synthase [Nymphaea thermarum]|nr:Isochorismate synthase [Nymphaea thermarum]